MQEQPPPLLNRRKQARLRLRPDLVVGRQTLEGRAAYFVKDPVALKYHYFPEREYFLLRLMDGVHTLIEIQEAFEEEFRPDRLREEDLEVFMQNLVQLGLAFPDSPQAGKQLFKNRQKRRLREWFQVLTNVLYIKIPVHDPDRLLGRMVPYTRWLFSTWFLLASAAAMLATLLFVGMHYAQFRARLPDAQEFFGFRMAVTLWIAIGAVKVLHEFGHGLACKAQGGEVHTMGILLLCFSPSLFCNVSDAWVLADKRRRLLVTFAGIYVELLIAVLATLAWWHAPGATFVNRLCLALMLVCSVNTVFFNANPLLRFDGYYVLATWLEIPDLREQANRYVGRLAAEGMLGVEMPPEPPMPLRRRLLFTAYSVSSFLYGWTLTFGILWFLYNFLKPYKLGTVGMLLAVAAVGLMIGRPLYSLGQYLHKRGWMLPEMKSQRVTIELVVVVVLLLAFFYLPLPVSRVRETALVQVRPEAVQKVFVIVPGVLTRLRVHDGQYVEAGDVLAEFTSRDLEQQLEEARSEHDIRMVHVQVLLEQIATTTDPARRAKLGVEAAAAEGERRTFAGQVKVYETMKERLVLRAPCVGVVMSPPKKDEVGKFWDKDQSTPLCSIGDPKVLHALVPVTPADYNVLRADLHDAGELAATIRVRGRESDTWQGRVGLLPESEAKEVPWGLSNRCGGPVAIQAGQTKNVAVPQEQYYLAVVNFQETDAGLCPGMLGQVKIHCRWRSGAWWLWRTLSVTFDLGLA